MSTLGSQLHTSHSTSDTSSSSASHSDSSMGSMGGHSTIFQTSIFTSLYSDKFTPKNNGQYAGMIIFLIVLAVIYRGLAAYKSILDHRLAVKSRGTVVLVAGKNDGEEGVVVERTNDEGAGAGSKKESSTMPWRISTEVPRAAMSTLNAGVGYLLMLAVMTMNVGYFMAVLVGYFLGDLFFGRFIKGESH